jgi:catechol 2,3-dioxygenase-like lactoylglutathione lyase family enzyme
LIERRLHSLHAGTILVNKLASICNDLVDFVKIRHDAAKHTLPRETRGFYEDFLGLRFVSAFEINEGRGLHSFFEMDDGSCLAFFEVPGKPFDFKRQDTLDLHMALGADPDVFDRMLDKARTEGVEVRGPVDHGFCRSIYMRDPNGYVVELTASTGLEQEIMYPSVSKPREALARWQAAKPGQPGAAA